jgi:hypothetical protein
MDSSNFFFREISDPSAIGDFSLNVTSDLEDDAKYQVRPFAENQNILVLGDVMSFISKGTPSPLINDFSPKSGGPGDIITINGANFSLSSNRLEVMIGADKGILISTTVDEIVFKLPDNLSKSGAVPLSVKSGSATVSADEPFSVDGHKILDFNPKQGIIGETAIVINGSGFLANGNIVRIGGTDMIVLEESETQIKVQLAYQMQAGPATVEVEVNGQIANANGAFTVKSRWTRLADFPGSPRLDAFCTVVGDFAYVIGGETGVYSDEVWRYDIAANSWTQLPNFPGGGRAFGIGFSIGTTLYYGLSTGSGGIEDFWSYNTLTGEWKQTHGLYSSNYPLSGSINGKGYILGGASGGIYSFTEADGWTNLPYTPETYATIYASSFVEVGGDPYILTVMNYSGESTGILYEVDKTNPANWNTILTLPLGKKSYNGIGFGTDNFAYFGEGVVEYSERLFIKLDVNTKQWTRIEDFQGPLIVRSAISFSHNNKGYVGFGLVRTPNSSTSYSTNEFWVYDPEIQ